LDEIINSFQALKYYLRSHKYRYSLDKFVRLKNGIPIKVTSMVRDIPGCFHPDIMKIKYGELYIKHG
jgi:hypothetical protein